MVGEKMISEFKFEKRTANTCRYREVLNPGESAKFGHTFSVIYLNSNVLENLLDYKKAPSRISVTVEVTK